MALGSLGLHAELVDLPGDLLDTVEHVLLARPAGRQLVAPRLRLGELPLDRLAHLRRLLRHRRELDLELGDATLRLVELHRGGVDLHAQPGGGLVDEVDRLVGQEAVGDVALREHGGGGERGVADADAVVRLVALLEAAEDRDRVGHRGLAHEHGLEAALERGVLLDVLAVLVERRRPDGAQLAAREHRLEQVAGRHGALGRAGADDRVQLVDEEDDLALGGGDLRQHRLEALLELAAVLGAGDQRADVERPDPLALQSLGHVSRDDPLGETLGDRGLADAGLADQHGVVLRAPREHLDDPADLLVAPDHGVELPGLGSCGEVAPVLLERLVAALGVLGCDPLPSAHVLQRAEQRIAGHELEREQQVLDGHELVLEPTRLLEGLVEHRTECGARLRLRVAAGDGRERAQAGLGLGADRVGGGSRPLCEGARQLLLEQGDDEVVPGQLGVAGAPRQLLGAGYGLAGLDRQLVEVHSLFLPVGRGRRRPYGFLAGGCGR